MTLRAGRQSALSRLADLAGRVRKLEREKAATLATFEIKVFSDADALSTGDGKFIFAIPGDLDGWSLTAAAAYVTTVSSSGLVTVQIRNVTLAADMLSTRITIDVGETTSYTAAAPAVIAAAPVAKGQLIAVDVDVAGTAAKGLGVILDLEP